MTSTNSTPIHAIPITPAQDDRALGRDPDRPERRRPARRDRRGGAEGHSCTVISAGRRRRARRQPPGAPGVVLFAHTGTAPSASPAASASSARRHRCGRMIASASPASPRATPRPSFFNLSAKAGSASPTPSSDGFQGSYPAATRSAFGSCSTTRAGWLTSNTILSSSPPILPAISATPGRRAGSFRSQSRTRRCSRRARTSRTPAPTTCSPA